MKDQNAQERSHREPTGRRLCMAFAVLCVLPVLYCLVVSLDLEFILQHPSSNMIRHHDGYSGVIQKEQSEVEAKNASKTPGDGRLMDNRVGGWPNPVIVVGLPKSGTTSVTQFFKCGGVTKVSHWRCKDGDFCGPMIKENVLAGKDPLFGTGNFDVYGQMDIEDMDRCYFPQIEALEEIHKAHPNSTFVFNSRNLTTWVKSVRGWYNMVDRLIHCNITGFPTGVGQKNEELIDFFTSQRQRVRDFVAKYPSHRLVEVKIDSPNAGKVMEDAFGIDRKCWGQTNVGKNIIPNWNPQN